MVAARARQLAAAGNDVLAVTFNIAAASHLRHLASRWPMAPAALQPTIRHFREWCGDLMWLRDPARRDEHFETVSDDEQPWARPFFEMVTAILIKYPLRGCSTTIATAWRSLRTSTPS